jgi:enoyl-CoA hydratase/carnithine racemase
MFYLNETLDASTAYSNGLITKVIDDADFDQEMMTRCTKIAGFSSQVRQITNARKIRFSCIST